MKNSNKSLDIIWNYVILSYLLFWVMVLGICGTASMVFHASPLTMRWLSDLCAWSPTFALLLMFKKLKPGMKLKDFFTNAFSGRIKISLLFISGFSVVTGTLISVFILSLIKNADFSSFFSLGLYSLPLSFLLSILSGPTGEESGWRGYLRCELENRFGFIKSSFILGIIWAFWHAVLWFIDCDFTGISFIIYIISNIIVMTALVIIMNVILKKSNNLFYAVWIHFCFNFPYCFINADILFYIILSVIYTIIAAVFLSVYLKSKNAY